MILRRFKITKWPSGAILFGGAVRDYFLHRKSTDFDWLVRDGEESAYSFAIDKSFVFPLDIERGIWRVIDGQNQHDFVSLNGLSIEEKLSKSDFTINAMAMTDNQLIIDPFGGRKDLKHKLIRAINIKNLADDSLRLLRAVRLVAQLNFKIEQQTIEWIKSVIFDQKSGNTSAPAPERVGYELVQLLSSDKVMLGLRVMDEIGLLDLYLPEILAAKGVNQGSFHHLDVFEHSIEALKCLINIFPQADLPIRIATLFHDIGKPATKVWDEERKRYKFYGHDKLGAEIANVILKRFRFPQKIIKKVVDLIRLHMISLPIDYKSAKRFVHRHREVMPELLQLMLADREAARGPASNESTRFSYQKSMDLVIKALEEPLPTKPLLTSQEIMDILNLKPGPKLGEAIRFLRESQAVGDAFDKESAKKILIQAFLA